MDWKFWLPLGVNIICMFLAFRQVQLMKPQIQAANRPKTLSSFWPMLIMVILVIAVWVPYLAGIGSTPPKPSALILAWGAQDNSCNVAVDGSRLMKFKDQFGVAFTCHLANTD